ncbi:MAG: hypothetical protein ABSH01_21140 [Terriglobia bacterium]
MFVDNLKSAVPERRDEAHGYVGLESVEHTLWEMLTWYDRWVKNAPASASVTAK